MSRFTEKAADIWLGEKANNTGLTTELQRLESLTLQQLAAEVMVKGFGLGRAALQQNAVERILSGGAL